MNKIGILHPGEMGVSVAASAIHSGQQVFWVSAGRSEQTRRRAEQQALIELHSLTDLCKSCEVIIAICPPHAAEDVASSVITTGFTGIYLDANAISPQRTKRIQQIMEENEIRFIDGSIIGGPAWKAGDTVLYLSGKDAEVIRDCFQNGPLETNILGEEVGKASAIKMCYAAYSKGTTALLASILASAEAYGVREDLYRQWNTDDPGFPEQVNQRVMRTTAKAWRFAGEMEEIADTLEAAGLPGGFHRAAAEVFERMIDREDDSVKHMEEFLAVLARKSSNSQ